MTDSHVYDLGCHLLWSVTISKHFNGHSSSGPGHSQHQGLRKASFRLPPRQVKVYSQRMTEYDSVRKAGGDISRSTLKMALDLLTRLLRQKLRRDPTALRKRQGQAGCSPEKSSASWRLLENSGGIYQTSRKNTA